MVTELKGLPKCQLTDGLVVLGFDPPSSKNAGWGCVKYENGKATLLHKHTQVIERERDDIGRMRDLYDHTKKLIEEFKPKILCLERSLGGGLQFVRGNLSEGVGVVKMCCYDLKIEVYEVSPGHLKKVITGYGKGKKKNIIDNVAAWFDLKKRGIEHECDAVAFGLCCLIDLGWKGYEINVPCAPPPKA